MAGASGSCLLPDPTGPGATPCWYSQAPTQPGSRPLCPAPPLSALPPAALSIRSRNFCCEAPERFHLKDGICCRGQRRGEVRETEGQRRPPSTDHSSPQAQTTAARAWALELSPGKRRSVQKDPRLSQAQGWGGGRPTETRSPLPTCPQLGHKSPRS